jgi:hypothetical protein
MSRRLWLVAWVLLASACNSADGTALPHAGAGGSGHNDGGAGASADACAPATCSSMQAQCGVAPDGCGGVLACGECKEGFCGGGGPNRCGTTPCTPKSCGAASCGDFSDGCSALLHCGACSAPLTCGGAGEPNQCGCEPTTCSHEHAECGSIPNGCGGTLKCGTCSGSDVCGLTEPNRCGCTPTTCSDVGAQCGAISDDCGGSQSCGDCVSPKVCGVATPNQCSVPCGAVGQPCCNGSCTGAYCTLDQCYAYPTLTDDYGDGAGCGNLGVAHPAPSYLIRTTVHGRPNAQAHRWCRQTSCGTAAFETVESPLQLDGTGTTVFNISYDQPLTDCADTIFGSWECWMIVDGNESNHASGVFYNSNCPLVANCSSAASVCQS